MDVSEVFIWHRDKPGPPAHMTTLQIEDWRDENTARLVRSFVGEQLTACYATVSDVNHELLAARANYEQDYVRGGTASTSITKRKPPSLTTLGSHIRLSTQPNSLRPYARCRKTA
jgi:hypothetical protein